MTETAPDDGVSLAKVVRFRTSTGLDVPFIFSSWLKSYAKARGLAGSEKAAYFRAQHAVIDRLLQRSQVLVACDPSDPGEVWGYCVNDTRAIHWVYVKQVFRRFGIATELLRQVVYDGPVLHSHQTRAGMPLVKRFNSTHAPEAAQ